MKNYKTYEKKRLGGSDIASLILVGISPSGGLKTAALPFGEDGEYSAYIVDEECEIPDYYDLAESFVKWARIHDDQGFTTYFYGQEINIYRAGSFGCIIQVKK